MKQVSTRLTTENTYCKRMQKKQHGKSPFSVKDIHHGFGSWADFSSSYFFVEFLELHCVSEVKDIIRLSKRLDQNLAKIKLYN